jgi:predicted  nucleic acid-binding Zn-ribbon protein
MTDETPQWVAEQAERIRKEQEELRALRGIPSVFHERDVWHDRAKALERDLLAAERRIAELEHELFLLREGT